MEENRLETRLLLLTVLLSGFSFLVYEVSWFRMLALMVGATVKASTIVLIAFMAGLGTGALFFGRRATQGRDPRRTAAFLLASTGLIGLASDHAIRLGVPALQALLARAGLSTGAADWLVLGASLSALFVPAFLMGGFLPVMAVLLVKDDRGLAGMTGRLYSTETLGSALGSLATGFVLIRWLGQRHTLYLAAAVNLLTAAALLLRPSQPIPDAGPGPESTPPARPKKAPARPAADRFSALLGAFAFGIAVAGLQVAWFRILRVHLTNTSYTFSLITAVVIFGLFAGSRFFARRDRTGDRREMTRTLLFAAFAAAAGFFLLVRLPELLMFPLGVEGGSYLVRIFAIPAVAALLVILPVTFASGYAFPMACAMYAPGFREIGGSMGRVYVASTAGAVVGPALAAFALIPGKGAALAVLFFAGLLACAAATLAWRKELAAGAVALLLLTVGLLPVVRIVPPSVVRFEREIVKYHETVEGTWLVAKGSGGREVAVSTYVNNSAVIGSSYDAVKAVKLVGHLPFFAGLRCRRALVVGFGIGVTTSAIASHAEVEHIDCVELVAGLREAAGFYSALNGNVHLDRRLRIMSGDGRHFLQSATGKYDLISSDPTHPVLGSGSLYTREYFELCRNHLNEGGMVSQYLPLHKLRLDDLLGIVKTFHDVFPGATVWLGHSHAVLLGSEKPLAVDFGEWSTRVDASERDPFFYANPHHLAACFLFDGKAIAAFPERVRLNTDDRPLTEFFTLSALDEGNTALNLAWLDEHRAGVDRFFAALPDAGRMQRFVAGNRLLTAGIVKDLAGDHAGFLRKLAEAVDANPENEEYPFLIKYFR
jgi:spermidine synthase